MEGGFGLVGREPSPCLQEALCLISCPKGSLWFFQEPESYQDGMGQESGNYWTDMGHPEGFMGVMMLQWLCLQEICSWLICRQGGCFWGHASKPQDLHTEMG